MMIIKKYVKMEILITGKAEFVGSHIYNSLTVKAL
jgi:nucleoside-diphosphate-sugar epimerase